MDVTEVMCENVVWVHMAQARVCSCFCKYGNDISSGERQGIILTV
jgi:hypothetical protein